VDKTISIYAYAIDTPDDNLIKAQNRHSIDKILGGIQKSYVPALMRALRLPVLNLNAQMDDKMVRRLYAIQNEYRQKFPDLFDGQHINPKKLVQSVPERPGAYCPGDTKEHPAV